MRTLVRCFGRQLQAVEMRSPEDFDGAFQSAVRAAWQALNKRDAVRVGCAAGHETSKEDTEMRLKDKIALITASASGIGRAAAVLFAREGAAVAVADIDKGRIQDTVAEIKAAGGRAHGIPCDLTKETDSRRIVREAIAAFGGLDILWNNIGHPGPGRIEDVNMDDYDVAMTLNVRSVLVTTTEAIPALRARGGGSILFTSSIAGIYGSPFSPVYSAAKFGVTGLTKSLAIRLAPNNIRVNCVCPAPIDTPMLDIFMGRPDVEANKHENLARMKQAIPLGRVGTPMEVAQAGLFLASGDASYITGVSLPVDGGYTAR
jgi:NAD(P)-dependent dehydrogenase (short-subunit alcohol dehydrogenase family)